MMPNFLIIGAPKSGTTSLYHYLRQHPDVFMSPVKEARFVGFYDDEPDQASLDAESRARHERIMGLSARSLAEYEALFDGVRGEKAVGEATPIYLYSRVAAANIHRHIPDVRLIAVLRNPADRAFSDFAMQIRTMRWETITNFEEALAAEDLQQQGMFAGARHYQRAGFYHEQLTRYFDLFDRNQIHIELYEDFSRDPGGIARAIFRHIYVDDGFEPDIEVRHNKGETARSAALRRALRVVPRPMRDGLKALVPASAYEGVRKRLTKRPECSPATRRSLIDLYRDDILRLQDLIERDLSSWLS